MKLRIEVNERALVHKDVWMAPNGNTILVTPPIGEDFWLMRVRLSENQAVVVFPKFGVIGCGFQREEDWNTNLPISGDTCSPEEIFAHIRHNKGDDSISDADCLKAIRMLKKAVAKL